MCLTCITQYALPMTDGLASELEVKTCVSVLHRTLDVASRSAGKAALFYRSRQLRPSTATASRHNKLPAWRGGTCGGYRAMFKMVLQPLSSISMVC